VREEEEVNNPRPTRGIHHGDTVRQQDVSVGFYLNKGSHVADMNAARPGRGGGGSRCSGWRAKQQLPSRGAACRGPHAAAAQRDSGRGA